MRNLTIVFALLSGLAPSLASADTAATESFTPPWQQTAGDTCTPAPEHSQAAECIEVAQFCIKPIKPIPTIKPIWCTGTWTQILECTPSCYCVWREVCLN